MNAEKLMRQGKAALCVALLLLIMLPAGGARAADVSVDGPDDLSRALRKADPGDVLLLAPGTYGAVTIKDRQGASGRPITLRSADPKDPAQFGALTLVDSAYITLDSLLFDYVYSPGDNAKLRPYRVIKSQHIAILNSVFDGDRPSDKGPTDAPYGTAFGLSVQGSSHIEIRGNEIRDFYRGSVIAQTAALVVADNNMHDIRMDGMNFAQVEQVLIENNHLHDFNRSLDSRDHADMIQFWTNQTDTPSKDIVIRGNILNSGKGYYTQSIFMRNDLVDRGLAGKEMYYKDMVIEENVIINAHLHGITVGETDGLTIANNTLIHNARSDGRKDDISLWTPQIRVSQASENVRIVRNVAPTVVGYSGQRDWVMESNFLVQDRNPRRPNYYDSVFVAAIAGNPQQLESFAYLPGGPLDGAGLGASRLAHLKKSNVLRPMLRALPDPVYRNRFTFDARPTLRTTSTPEEDLRFSWALESGQIRNGAEISHTFADPGQYKVGLTVTQPDGSEVKTETLVTIPPVEVLRFDSASGEFTTWKNGIPELASGVAQSNGPAVIGQGRAVQEVHRDDIAPFFEARDFDLQFRIRSAEGFDTGGEILRVHGTLLVNSSSRGILEVELMTSTADRLRLRARRNNVLDGAWHDIRLVYSASRGLMTIFIDGAEVASGRSSGKLKPLQHWGLSFGNPFGNRKTFDGELDYLLLKANTEAMAPV